MRIAARVIVVIAVVAVIWFVRALAADRERSAPIVEVLNVGTRPMYEVRRSTKYEVSNVAMPRLVVATRLRSVGRKIEIRLPCQRD